jgi:addiction module toxin, relE/stbE family
MGLFLLQKRPLHLCWRIKLYQIVYTNRMKRDVRRARKRGKDMNKLISVLQVLQHGNSLPEKYRDHQLGGNLRDFRECHIEPDWLLLYQIHEDQLILSASATGTHADLFGA